MLEKIKKLKGLPCILIALAAGLVLLLLPKPASGEAQAEAPDPAGDYRALLERETEELLLSLDGVRECRVMITLSGGYEYLYATDQEVRETSGGKETRKTVVLATESGGEKPVTLRESPPTVKAVAVALPGADGETTKNAEALLLALFGEAAVCVKN